MQQGKPKWCCLFHYTLQMGWRCHDHMQCPFRARRWGWIVFRNSSVLFSLVQKILFQYWCEGNRHVPTGRQELYSNWSCLYCTRPSQLTSLATVTLPRPAVKSKNYNKKNVGMSMKGATADAWFLVLVYVRMAAINESRRCFEKEFVDGDFWQCYILLPISVKGFLGAWLNTYVGAGSRLGSVNGPSGKISAVKTCTNGHGPIKLHWDSCSGNVTSVLFHRLQVSKKVLFIRQWVCSCLRQPACSLC